MSMMRSLPITLVVVAALILILMTLQADADDAILKHGKESKWQLLNLNQTAFGRKALAGGKDAEQVGESKKASVSGYMYDSENGESDGSNNNTDNNSGNNSAFHLNNHHYFTDPRKLPPRN